MNLPKIFIVEVISTLPSTTHHLLS